MYLSSPLEYLGFAADTISFLHSYVMMKRSEIRERFGIDGDGMGDCCTAYWCVTTPLLPRI